MQKKIKLGRILTAPLIATTLLFTTAISLHAALSVYSNESVTLIWETTSVNNCTASNNYTPNTSIWSGVKGAAGSLVLGAGTFNQAGVNTYTFTLNCTGNISGNPRTATFDLQVTNQANVNLAFNNTGTGNPFVTLDLTADKYNVSSRQATTLRWNFSAAGGTCTASGNWSGAKAASGNVSTGINYDEDNYVTKNYTLSCTGAGQTLNSSISVTFGPYGSTYVGGGACFIAGTKVLMADGSKKNIEDVTWTDSLMSSNGPERVMKRYHIPYKGLIYAFNNSGNYFVTPTHPFMTTEGWKSLDPEGTRRESPGIQVSKLEIGDNLVLHGDRYMTLTALDSVSTSTTVYNFGINGTHDFYADDYLVHNVSIFETAHALQNIQVEK